MRPRLRIELLRLKHRNEVFVAELVLRPISRNVMFENIASLGVHLARIPLTAKSRHRIDPPMNEDAELRVLVPLGNLIGVERLIVRPERAPMTYALDVGQ